MTSNARVKQIINYHHLELSVQTSRQELHNEVEVPLVLEAVEHFDHPGAVRLHQNIPLCPDMSNLQGDRRQSKTLTMQEHEYSSFNH